MQPFIASILAAALLTTALPALAGPWEDGNAAYESGNFEQAAKLYEQAAGQGNAEAAFLLGSMYAKGWGVEKSEARAVEWLRRAADLGSVDALINLGDRYSRGDGVPQSDGTAAKWYRKALAVDADNTHAKAPLREVTRRGMDLYAKRMFAEAARSFLSFAREGDAEKQFLVARMYESGQGVAQSDAEAVKWYRAAADQGHAYAQYRLGQMYAHGRGVDRSESTARSWYEKAAAQGHAGAYYTLAMQFGTDEATGFPKGEGALWLYRAAIGGHTGGARMLVNRIQTAASLKPADIDPDDQVLFQRQSNAALSGDPEAQYLLGVLYQFGIGTPQDFAKAREFYRKAADQGHDGAMRNLGSLYLDGLGVPRALGKAVEWIHKAAGWIKPETARRLKRFLKRSPEEACRRELGVPDVRGNDARAQFTLAVMYASGIGMNNDGDEYLNWIGKAAKQGQAEAMLLYAKDELIAQWNDWAGGVWFVIAAAEQGNESALMTLKRMRLE